MHIVLHTGAHFTEEDRLMKCLLRNKQDFAQRGVAVPGPGRYRMLIRDTLSALNLSEPSEEAREVLLDAILDQQDADRMILSNAHFFGAPRSAVRHGQLYPRAIEKLGQFLELFPDDTVEMFVALKNPAIFLPEAFGQSPRDHIVGFMGGGPPDEILWSNMLIKIRRAYPQVQITTWCNEDAPLIWAQIIREMAGLPEGERIIGGFDLLSSIMSREGMLRFRAYLHDKPDLPEPHKRKIMAAFLDKYVLDEMLDEELDLPGWTDDLVEDMTDAYDDDMARVASLPGVTLLTP